jgi:hypothetical protein
MNGETFNILSLDGGGTWALIEAIALRELFGSDTPGHQILQHFRLVVANSGGSIVAAGLWANMTPRQLIEEFQSDSIRRHVFRKRPFYRQLTRVANFGPKYRARSKLKALKAVLELRAPGLADSNMGDLKRRFGTASSDTDLVIVGFDYDTNRAKFFRTNAGSLAGTQKDKPQLTTTLAEAVHASTNAPVNYFDDPAEIKYAGQLLRMWDGAIAGYNNPILAGITEALANRIPRDIIQVLSLGTGSRMLPRADGREAEHPWLIASPYKRTLVPVIGDVRKLAMSIVENPPDVATYMAFHMLGETLPTPEVSLQDKRRQETRIVRLNPMMQPTVNPVTKKFDTPGADTRFEDALSDEAFDQLLRLDMDAVRASEVDIIFRFADLWIKDQVYNQPILAGASSLECELGHRWFSHGRDHARKIALAPEAEVGKPSSPDDQISPERGQAEKAETL